MRHNKREMWENLPFSLPPFAFSVPKFADCKTMPSCAQFMDRKRFDTLQENYEGGDGAEKVRNVMQ